MSPRSWLERIEYFLTCARNILKFTTGMDLDAFMDDPFTSHAVAFEFTTMGEAARAMPTEAHERYLHHPWEKRQTIRKVLVHEYFPIDEETLWRAS